MNNEQLLARRQQAQDSFDKLAEERDQTQQKLNDINSELLRLQGEYRIVQELLGPEEAPESPDTIDARPAEAKAAKK